MKPKRLLIFYSFVFGLILATIFTFWGRGSFIHFLYVFIASVWIAVPLILLSLICYWLGFFWKPSVVSWVSTIFLGLAIIMLIQILSLIGGKILHEKDLRDAKKYCESLINSIELIKVKTGQYPSNIQSVLPSSLPVLLRRENFYWSDGNSYSFDFSDPAEMMMSYGFSSKTKHWERYD